MVPTGTLLEDFGSLRQDEDGMLDVEEEDASCRRFLVSLALEVEGPAVSLYLADENAPARGQWPLAYMNSYGMTIAAGTSEIQRNILGERVLGLAKSK